MKWKTAYLIAMAFTILTAWLCPNPTVRTFANVAFFALLAVRIWVAVSDYFCDGCDCCDCDDKDE